MVGRENVIASTDCGFAQLEQYQRVHPQVMWAKRWPKGTCCAEELIRRNYLKPHFALAFGAGV
jgi:hypothetical protein